MMLTSVFVPAVAASEARVVYGKKVVRFRHPVLAVQGSCPGGTLVPHMYEVSVRCERPVTFAVILSAPRGPESVIVRWSPRNPHTGSEEVRQKGFSYVGKVGRIRLYYDARRRIYVER
ncbi:hypothetical protein [Thermosulfurimonas sp. F29]|uniref:hypothetical protein n=1 Tax=Thermosulfurimonas sp. F29 TaxID=2867247 RepID=UPI001C833F1C|nr:hypothetical protein [Thermosulfurimonas sp. F29]MBX6424110.1 hypothetical protein [Thermosulfurimonas sp. F29]